MNSFKPRPGDDRRLQRGFSLIVTISLVILLALLSVGLLTLSSISLRSSSRLAAQSRAQANARLGLMIALGDLQKYAGPDRRITARAETLAQDERIGGAVTSESPRAWWVGVSPSDRDESLGSGDQAAVWLVSGLDRGSDAGDQINGGFDSSDLDPVPLFTERSLDLQRLTGGEPIMAGRVGVANEDDEVDGAFAYFVDDNGMKAQLAASNSLVRNDRPRPLGGGVLPGTFDIGILDGMNSIEGTDLEDFSRLGSIRDLPFLGAPLQVAKEKYFSYTTQSRGVLSDVREGGLKRDLTIAFEREDVFSRVFPKGSGYDPRYVVMDREKFQSASDLQSNGYIHFGIFKDYYNIKKYIELDSTDTEMLDPVLFTKKGVLWGDFENSFGQGRLGPHDIGGSGTPSEHRQMPYGDYPTLTRGPGKTNSNYKQSPVLPILSRLHQNAWVEAKVPRFGRPVLETNVQVWGCHYNPYNISLKLVGDKFDRGPRLVAYPQVRFTVPGILDEHIGLGTKRESHVPYEVLLYPGRSHVCTFGSSGTDANDNKLYTDLVRERTLDSVFTTTPLNRPPTGSVSMEVEFYFEKPAMGHGADDEEDEDELAQIIWAPYAWDKVTVERKDSDPPGVIYGDHPGKKIRKTVNANELNENAMVSQSFHLRSTREGGNSLRPLVDANIRAQLCNTKWDSNLGVSVLAAYSPENAGEVDEPFFPMDTSDPPRGYSYWGAGRDPVDGFDRVILFDIPRKDLVSLGQLQHAGASRFSYEPSYVVGNSYANPRIPQDDWVTSANDTLSNSSNGLADTSIQGSFNLYDASYLVNEVLWDSYIFTTIPQVRDDHQSEEPNYNGGYFEDLLAGDAFLPNPRFLPYEPTGSSWEQETLQDPGRGGDEGGSFYHNAGHLLVDGAFNVNSTSVDAWEAFLSGTHQLPVRRLTENGRVGDFQGASEAVRFPRVEASFGEGATGSGMDENFWTGFRELTQQEVRELAVEIVEEVRERGPFLTLGEFVNRKLDDDEAGASGALQAALDRTVNQSIDNSFGDEARHPALPDGSLQAAGFSGYLLQGDILQALSPYMTPRSDTFTIRSYGEARAPDGDIVLARAWCEAVVQRVPDACPDRNSGEVLEELASPTSPFGRQFRLVSFRWLSPEEV